MRKLLVPCSKRSVDEKKQNSKWHNTECLEEVKLMTETPNGHKDKFAPVSLPRQLV